MSILYMMIGIPGSGKSTYAEELAKKENAKIVSSDNKRKEIFGDETVIKDNHKIFSLCNKDILNNLKDGKNVIFDATNTSMMKRKNFIKNFRNCADKIIGVFINTSYDVCISRNKMRKRKVNEIAIERMYKTMEIPTRLDGFDDIIVINTDIIPKNDNIKTEFQKFIPFITDGRLSEIITEWHDFVNKYIPEYSECIGFNQNNPHHSLTLDKHMEKANELMNGFGLHDYILGMTTIFHDIGKAKTKVLSAICIEEFRNIKVNKKLYIIEEQARFYKVFMNHYDITFIKKENVELLGYAQYLYHDNVSAQLFLLIAERLGLDKETTLEIATLISLHMCLPYGEYDEEIYKRRYKEYYPKITDFNMLDTYAK